MPGGNTHAWWLPAGSIRALLALVLVGAFIAAVFYEVEGEGVTALAAMAGSSVTFYFTKRNGQDR